MAARLPHATTPLSLFSQTNAETKEEAYDYLKGLGLIDIINEAIGTILLEMPEKDVGYGEAICNAVIHFTMPFTPKSLHRG